MKPTGKTFFVSERHKALHRSTVNLLLHTCSKAAALPFLSHPHMLRHACGFALADQGADTRLIQDCLGNRGATLPFMSDLGKVGWFRPFAVDFGTEVMGAEREGPQAQIRDTASLLHRAGSASFGRGLAADAR